MKTTDPVAQCVACGRTDRNVVEIQRSEADHHPNAAQALAAKLMVAYDAGVSHGDVHAMIERIWEGTK